MFFDNDLETIGGWHDGTGVTVRGQALNSALVLAHEAVHGRIFSETLDGQVHRLCIVASQDNALAQRFPVYGTIAKRLFLESRTAHEAAATYLAIQGAPKRKERLESFSDLSSEYKKYYRMMSELIDPCASTSWVRYALAWTLTFWCFSSTRARDFFASAHPSMAPFDQTVGPDQRFSIAIRFLQKGNRARKWARDSIKEAKKLLIQDGLDPFDIDNESVWDGLKGNIQAQVFENHLTTVAGKALQNIIPGQTANVEYPDENFGPGCDFVLIELGMIPEKISTAAGSPLNIEWQQKYNQHRAISQSNVKIDHDVTCHPSDLLLDADRIMLLESLFENCDHVSFISNPNSDDHIFVLYRTGSIVLSKDVKTPGPVIGDLGSFNLNLADATSILDLHVHINPHKIHTLLLFSKNNRSKALAIFTKLALIRSNDKSYSKIPSDNIIWYFNGPWTDITLMSEVEVTNIPLRLLDGTGDPLPVSVRVARIEKSGIFVSLKSSWAGSTINKFENDLIEDGRIKRFDCDQEHFSKIMIPVTDAWHTWKTI